MKPLRSLVLVVIAITATTALAVDSGVAAAATRTRTITVVGTGEVRGTPDVADLVLGVSGRGATAAEVMRTIGERAQRVIDALREAGVAEEDVQTNTLWVHPVLDDQNRVDGYEATNTVTARIRDLGAAGSVIDSAAERAGDNIVVQGITFSIDDDSELLANARTKATRRARAQAEQLASGAGVEVGDVKSIAEATSSVPLAYAADAAREAASTPVEPGSATLSVSATVVFTIR
jgi:uncharacterized protein YggE